MKTNFETLSIDLTDKIVTITVNRPKALNALSQQVLGELKEVLTSLNNTDFDYTGVILTGEGDRAFIAGADIKAMEDMDATTADNFCKLGQDVSLLFEKLTIPVIACVNGFALGGGCEMAMSCDFIYATENAIFGQPEVNLGLIPGFGGTQRLVRFVGAPRAKELIYTGRNVKSEEAYKIGLVQRLFSSKEEMMSAARETLALIGSKSPLIVSKCKEVICAGEFESIENGLDIERTGFAWCFGTEDMKEGVRAFIEKRAPEFKGR